MSLSTEEIFGHKFVHFNADDSALLNSIYCNNKNQFNSPQKWWVPRLLPKKPFVYFCTCLLTEVDEVSDGLACSRTTLPRSKVLLLLLLLEPGEKKW
jgi:hypothetical protein